MVTELPVAATVSGTPLASSMLKGPSIRGCSPRFTLPLAPPRALSVNVTSTASPAGTVLLPGSRNVATLRTAPDLLAAASSAATLLLVPSVELPNRNRPWL